MTDTSVVPPFGPDWQQPVSTWTLAIDRYIAFVQVPAWRVSIKRGGGEKAGCLGGDEARTLEKRMRSILDLLSVRQGVEVHQCQATVEDLVTLWNHRGRQTPRHDRCPSRLHWHFQRAFLLNACGYTCGYCRRTAWGVYAEDAAHGQRRTLRFEVDHRVPKRALMAPDCFDPSNLVAVCRSCNAIKAELPEERFRRELESLARAVMATAS